MNDFILEINNFIMKDEIDHFLKIIIDAQLPFEKNSYNVHGENYEYHNAHDHERLKLTISDYQEKVGYEIAKYFSRYDVQTFKQNFLSGSILYLKSEAMIPKHTDDQYDRGVVRSLGVLIYLNSPAEGGELLFPLQKKMIKPESGKLVIFPSFFSHPHMVLPTSEDRYALRLNYGMEL
jgi:hypothetical protein